MPTFPADEEKIGCKVRIKGETKDYEGTAHIFHVPYRKIHFWFGSVELATSADPLECPDFLGKPIILTADDGRTGHAIPVFCEMENTSIGYEDRTPGEFVLLTFVGTCLFAGAQLP